MEYHGIAILVALCLSYVAWGYLGGKSNYINIPGPRGIPLFNNAFQNPKEQEWIQYTKWSKQYGPLYLLRLFRQHVIILNSRAVATDLLEKRSTLYSDRPRLVMAGELIGWNQGVTLISSGERHKRYRKYLHGTLSSTATKNFWPVQEREAHGLLLQLLESPEDFLSHIRRAVTASIVQVAYGHQITSNDDPYVILAQEAQEKFSLAATPNTFAVDWFPLLQYLPEWFPGLKYKSIAREWRKELMHLLTMPIQEIKLKIEDGSVQPSYASSLLGHDNVTEEMEQEIAWSALSLYTGGADTTVAALATFILILVRHPDIAERIQQEIDSVTEGTRLPSFQDRDSLPFLKACLMEVLRWRPVIPLGVAHKVNQDDEYHGYHIAKDTIVISNIWAMMHDETVYPEPDKFIPERFMGVDKDSALLTFGFGRRICVGMHTAQDSMFIMAALMCSSFNFRPLRDKNGKEMIPEARYTTGLISHPLPFACEIKPRSPAVTRLIRHAEIQGI